ncbi:hypothetical protein HPB48_004751 [Haemaphysalis longicornis]|uniref:DDE-1 domain-containing protein n=1 Tax=Haemaphysalis longicornis TaxID=44386 RepID=A0A9J6G326_HAELO|nr:hypothetical protein HPB48_004751 [Haemaphysalis longicornis]
MLCVTADGQEATPVRCVEKEEDSQRSVPQGYHSSSPRKGWMNADLVLDWVKCVWPNRPGAVVAKRSLLVLDSFRGHLTDKVKEQLAPCRHRHGRDSGRPHWNAASHWTKREPTLLRLNSEGFTLSGMGKRQPRADADGRLKRPPLATVLGWILSAWSLVATDVVSRSFKVTGISNSLDGAEDEACGRTILRNTPPSDSEPEDSLSDDD